MEAPTITFDQLPHVVGGLSEKLDRVLELLEKAGFTGHSKQSKPSRRLVYAKEACQIIGKSLSSLYRGIKATNNPTHRKHIQLDRANRNEYQQLIDL